MNGANRFETLDAMRGIAALMVIPRHTEMFGAGAAESHSYLAVDLFFILSGFVIAHAYERQILSGAMSVGRFMAIRLVRLYPMFLLAVCLATLAALTRPAFEPSVLAKWTPAGMPAADILSSAALTLLFLPSKLGDSVLLFPLNTAFWSLMFELVVNLLYVCVCRKISTKGLIAIAIGAGLGLGALALRRNGMELGWSWGLNSIIFGLLRASFGFTTGVLLLRLFSIQAPIKSNFGALLILVFTVTPLLLPDSSRTNGLVDNIAVLAIFPMAIWLGAHSHPHGWALRAFTWLGAASYPVYVMHVPLLILFERYTHQAGLTQSARLGPLLAPAFLIGIFALAIVLDRWYDQPLRRWLMNRFDLRRPTASPLTKADIEQARLQAGLPTIEGYTGATPTSATPTGTTPANSGQTPAPETLDARTASKAN